MQFAVGNPSNFVLFELCQPGDPADACRKLLAKIVQPKTTRLDARNAEDSYLLLAHQLLTAAKNK